MNIRQLRKRVRRELTERAASSRLAAARDRRVVARSLGTPSATGPHLLIASAGAGNIGDQAMVESFVESVPGDVVVVTRGAADFRPPECAAGAVRFTAFPALIHGSGSARAGDLRRFAELLATASSLSIIGADVMDGRYSQGASVRRATLAESAAASAIPTRILGFSWNEKANPRARTALCRAAAAGAVPLLRDPVSAARARADGVTGVRESADIVFTARHRDPSVADTLGPLDPPRLAVVNASALVGRGIDQVCEYRVIVDYLLDNGFRVVLLPHVSRSTSDDIKACADVFAAVLDARGPDRSGTLTFVDRLLSPAAVRGLTGRASVTVTGRMHLAIMSLQSAVPAVTLTTQGKVEGLMQMFGTPQLCVQPRQGMSQHVIAVLEEIIAGPLLSDRIRSALPAVIALAEKNVEPLSTGGALQPADPNGVPMR